MTLNALLGALVLVGGVAVVVAVVSIAAVEMVLKIQEWRA